MCAAPGRQVSARSSRVDSCMAFVRTRHGVVVLIVELLREAELFRRGLYLGLHSFLLRDIKC